VLEVRILQSLSPVSRDNSAAYKDVFHSLDSMDAPDTIVAAVIQKFLDRAAMGKKKYGVTLDRTDLKTLDWIQHAQEELMDGILYLEKLKQTLTPGACVK